MIEIKFKYKNNMLHKENGPAYIFINKYGNTKTVYYYLGIYYDTNTI